MKNRKKVISVLLTPKFIKNFDNPDEDINKFFKYYKKLLDEYKQIIIIFGIGNSDQILKYRGPGYLNDNVPWDRYINFTLKNRKIISEQTLNYHQIKNIVRQIKYLGKENGYGEVKVFDLLDPGPEFCERDFKENRHLECMYLDDPRNPNRVIGDWAFLDIISKLKKDSFQYSSYPEGIPEGTKTSDFVINQTRDYLKDMDMEGIWLQNAFGTVGQWDIKYARGYSEEESREILYFFKNLKLVLEKKEIMWFDSYWPKEYEHDYWSVPDEAYEYMAYLQIATYAVLCKSERIRPNLVSKMNLPCKLIYSVDFVDPWYDYNTYKKYPERLRVIIEILKENIHNVDGIQIWANDEQGKFISRNELGRLKGMVYGKE